ncbi:MAG: hypothetical protein ACTHNA_07815 [Sphingopyxis terrae]|jgi:hypothetical protein|uniref:hypothetical protein n=1 Tax=unclassified Sphingopyxis TaxID=2614943 RepID=UPI00086CF596|nr:MULTISPECIES: hypothetical protein [unclassified Sphingopyxis]MBL9067250.1 hypothetical protein [Sphingopyxis sp.]ODU27193.1 MAG: hypothetical protein ABS88_16810 [Sphingopyxis sp. SCN 67-31]HUN11589.1 hypothetical protein [Rhabdaerophilum sp.]
MSGAPLRLLMLFVLLLSGLHNAAPAAAGMSHHATDSHLAHHADVPQAPDSDADGKQDADLHGSHHNCPVASDQALSGNSDLTCFSGGLHFALPATRLASRALAPPLNPPLA